VRYWSGARGMPDGMASGHKSSGPIPVARFLADAAAGTAGRLWAIGTDDTAAGSARRQPGPERNTGDWADSGWTGAPATTATSGRYSDSGSSAGGKAARIRRSDTAAADGTSQECERRRGRHWEPEPGKGLDFYSLEREIALGKSLAQEVERSSKLIDDPVVTEYVNRVGQNLVRNSGCAGAVHDQGDRFGCSERVLRCRAAFSM